MQSKLTMNHPLRVNWILSDHWVNTAATIRLYPDDSLFDRVEYKRLFGAQREKIWQSRF